MLKLDHYYWSGHKGRLNIIKLQTGLENTLFFKLEQFSSTALKILNTMDNFYSVTVINK